MTCLVADEDDLRIQNGFAILYGIDRDASVLLLKCNEQASQYLMQFTIRIDDLQV